MAASTSLAFTTKTTTSGDLTRNSSAIDSRADAAPSLSAGGEPSCMPRVSRIESDPPSFSYSYQRPRPVCAVTWPSAASFAPKSALTSDDLPAPRRPTKTSAGGRFSSSTVRSVAMRTRRSVATSSGNRSSRSSRRVIARASILSVSSSAGIGPVPPGINPLSSAA